MKHYGGMTLIFIGVILLAIVYLTGWSHFNFLLLTGLTIIVLGMILHVWLLKRDEKY